MSQTAITIRYIEALIGAAEERNSLEEVEEEVQAVLDLLESSSELQEFFLNSMIPAIQKQSFVNSLLSGKLSELMLNFLMLLCEKRRERVLVEILEEFQAKMDERRGIVTAQVRSASRLTSEQEDQLVSRLSSFSGKQVRLESQIDDSITAGFVATLGDQVFDGTLETQLHRLRRKLVG